jgi:hypothetical protein
MKQNMKHQEYPNILVVLAALLMVLVVKTQAQTPSFAWAKRVASTVNTNDELAIGFAMYSSANVYAAGWFDGANDFGGSLLTNQSVGGQDIFVAKLKMQIKSTTAQHV